VAIYRVAKYRLDFCGLFPAYICTFVAIYTFYSSNPGGKHRTRKITDALLVAIYTFCSSVRGGRKHMIKLLSDAL
jgi:hypothetical protein